MIINEIVISRLEEFIKRPIPEDYAPFRRELMELIQEGTISLDNQNLLRYLLAVDFRIRDYQPSPDPLLGVTLSESASMNKHSSESFAIRQLDWMITKYRPNLTKELEATSQLPIWTDEDTRRN